MYRPPLLEWYACIAAYLKDFHMNVQLVLDEGQRPAWTPCPSNSMCHHSMNDLTPTENLPTSITRNSPNFEAIRMQKPVTGGELIKILFCLDVMSWWRVRLTVTTLPHTSSMLFSLPVSLLLFCELQSFTN